ncbi:MAG: hypothetical protein IJ105_00330 [Bacilli bacterium]|nr:hypothetical protein [Bacilli bacterium]
MLDKYLDSQDVVTNLLLNSIKNNKLSQAYLFVCDDIDYIYEYAKDFIKEIIKMSLLDDEKLNNIFKRIDKNEYTELKVVESFGQFIKKDQLLDLQNSVLNKPVESNKMFYIIKNADKLNAYSANSILKFLEEPADDIIAILLTNNLNMIIPTIKSRCQVLNFKNIKNNFNNNIYNFIESKITDEEKEILINSSLEIVNSLEKKKINSYIYFKKLFTDQFDSHDNMLLLFNFLTYLYVNCLYKKTNKKIENIENYEEIIEYINKNNEISDIITKINLFESLKNDLKNNVNSKLIFDRLIIEFNEVK